MTARMNPSSIRIGVHESGEQDVTEIDWNAPLEAVHEDGRIVPVELDPDGFMGSNPDRDGDYWTKPNNVTAECWASDGDGNRGWLIRNVAVSA